MCDGALQKTMPVDSRAREVVAYEWLINPRKPVDSLARVVRSVNAAKPA